MQWPVSEKKRGGKGGGGGWTELASQRRLQVTDGREKKSVQGNAYVG